MTGNLHPGGAISDRKNRRRQSFRFVLACTCSCCTLYHNYERMYNYFLIFSMIFRMIQPRTLKLVVTIHITDTTVITKAALIAAMMGSVYSLSGIVRVSLEALTHHAQWRTRRTLHGSLR